MLLPCSLALGAVAERPSVGIAFGRVQRTVRIDPIGIAGIDGVIHASPMVKYHVLPSVSVPMDGDEWDAVPSTKLLSGSGRHNRMPSQVVAICATWQQRRNNKGGDQWEWHRHLTRTSSATAGGSERRYRV